MKICLSWGDHLSVPGSFASKIRLSWGCLQAKLSALGVLCKQKCLSQGVCRHNLSGVSNRWNGIWNGTVEWNETVEWNGTVEWNMEWTVNVHRTAKSCN